MKNVRFGRVCVKSLSNNIKQCVTYYLDVFPSATRRLLLTHLVYSCTTPIPPFRSAMLWQWESPRSPCSSVLPADIQAERTAPTLTTIVCFIAPKQMEWSLRLPRPASYGMVSSRAKWRIPPGQEQGGTCAPIWRRS